MGRVVLEEESEEEEREGCSAAVKRSERRLRSMLREEIRLLPQLSGTVRQLLILDGPAHNGEYCN